MAVKLDREQLHTLGGILAVARKMHAPRKDILSAVETALVEANLHNPRSAAASGAGSGSSVGWRQETASSYPNVNRASVHGAAKRFFDELRKAPGGSAGRRAQAVQRSAYPGKYDQAQSQAEAILRSYAGKGVHGALADKGLQATSGSRSVTTTTPPSLISTVDPVTALDPALQQLLGQSGGAGGLPSVPQPAAPVDPWFTARRSLPSATGAVPGFESTPPAGAQGPSIEDLLSQVAQLGSDAGLPQTQQSLIPGSSSTVVTQGGSGSRAVSQGASRGSVKVAAGADRAGVSTQPIVKKAVSVVAGATHHPVTITTGTNHSRMTVNGNVSDHWSGHAADIGVPVDSHQGDLIAAAALEQLAGVPASKARQMVRQGGLWTFTPKRGPVAGHRIQIIWRTMQGGNHHNHVHIGVR